MGVEERSDQQQRLVEQASSHCALEIIGFRCQVGNYARKGHVSESVSWALKSRSADFFF